MAQIFSQDSAGGWSVIPVPTEAVRLTGTCPVDIQPISLERGNDPSQPEIHPTECAGRQVWVMLIPPNYPVWINGRRATQIRLLRHRDSIWVNGNEPLFFSTERLAAVEVFTGREDRVDCARCKSEVRPDQRMVVCPECGTYHHSDASIGLECWSYSPRCCGCNYSTDLNDELRWVPEVS